MHASVLLLLQLTLLSKAAERADWNSRLFFAAIMGRSTQQKAPRIEVTPKS